MHDALELMGPFYDNQSLRPTKPWARGTVRLDVGWVQGNSELGSTQFDKKGTLCRAGPVLDQPKPKKNS